jgi:hypothetical protein
MLCRNILYSTAIFLTVSCGSKDSNSPQAEPVDTRPVFSLSGLASTTWVRDCEKITDRNRSVRETVILNDNTFVIKNEYFDGFECAEGLKRSTFNDLLKQVYKDELEKIPGWTTYSFKVDAVTAAIHQQRLVAVYNEYKAYGLQGWELNIEKNISGLAYDAESEKERAAGAISERTILVEGDSLYFAIYEGDVPVANKEQAYTRR